MVKDDPEITLVRLAKEVKGGGSRLRLTERESSGQVPSGNRPLRPIAVWRAQRPDILPNGSSY
jgi:hypothetical protein